MIPIRVCSPIMWEYTAKHPIFVNSILCSAHNCCQLSMVFHSTCHSQIHSASFSWLEALTVSIKLVFQTLDFQESIRLKDVQCSAVLFLCSSGLFTYPYKEFSGAFTKLRKVTVTFILCLSIHPFAWNNAAPTGQISMKFGNFFF